MKPLLSLLGLCLLTATTAHAASRFTGEYFGLSYSGSRLVAGVNLTVRPDNTFVGHGAYADLTPTTLSGKIDGAGKATVTEKSGGKQTKYTATFKPNGKKFTAHLSGGNVFKGVKISDSFLKAGIYHAETDLGDEGIFLVQKDGDILGILYTEDGDAIEVEGTADSDGFNGETEDGVSFLGTFHGNSSFSGTYILDDGTEGDFSGKKY